MQLGFINGITSVVLRLKFRKLSDGTPYTGLDHTSSGLILAATADNEQGPVAGSGAGFGVAYTVAGGTIETITTLGTFAAPTATKCRFKAVDATNHPGLYEVQLADARWAVSGARSVNFTASGVSDLESVDTVIQLGQVTGINMSNVVNPTATVNLSGTTVGTAETIGVTGLAAIWNRLTSALSTAGSIGKLIVDNLASSGSLAADVWAYTTRTLTQTSASIAAAIDGDDISIQRGDTVSISVTGLGSLASRTGEKLWFTVKAQTGDADTAATIQVGETTGAIRLNGGATTASYASISVTDAVTGALTITLKPALTSALVQGTSYKYDIQILETAVVRTLSSGTATVVADVTRATG